MFRNSFQKYGKKQLHIVETRFIKQKGPFPEKVFFYDWIKFFNDFYFFKLEKKHNETML
jgi:hypothetical protein